MRRLHLFEWQDQAWLPRVFRDFITDHLRCTQDEPMRHPVNVAVAERLKALLERVHARRIIDLCAGSGGPLARIGRILGDDLHYPVEIVLTDFFPNIAAFKRIEKESNGTIKPRLESISALDVPSGLEGVRTIFTALHHFKPEEARLILADAVRKGAALAIFEPLERTLRMVLLVGLMSFMRGFTHTPRVGHLSPSRLLATYLFPLAPAFFAWDGMVSALRTYTPDELSALASSVGSDGYTWETGRFEVAGPFGPMPTIYLIGFPARTPSMTANLPMSLSSKEQYGAGSPGE